MLSFCDAPNVRAVREPEERMEAWTISCRDRLLATISLLNAAPITPPVLSGTAPTGGSYAIPLSKALPTAIAPPSSRKRPWVPHPVIPRILTAPQRVAAPAVADVSDDDAWGPDWPASSDNDTPTTALPSQLVLPKVVAKLQREAADDALLLEVVETIALAHRKFQASSQPSPGPKFQPCHGQTS